ncbi:MAG: hypothetical protein BMS9Abin12_1963 [Acidimicrobiia bacterium]|nr:MAG: hypothetical protein BMS9Abin12_1963 [Acidimicrobiia bacterium]
MPRFIVALVAFGVLLSACQSSTSSEPTSTAGASTSTTQSEPRIGLDRIAVSTVTGGIAVHDATGAAVSSIDPPDGSIYRQPTWLDASTVVFSEVSDSGDHSLTAMDADTGRVIWRAGMETPPFYFLPAPTGSPYGTTSLRSDPSGAGLIAELVDRAGDVTSLSDESPFYTSWSPGGETLAIHIPGQRLDVVRSGETETILSESGLFQTPVWVDRGLVTLRSIEGTQRLTIWSDGTFTDIAEVEGPVGFVASGDLIALQATERPDAGSIAAGIRTQLLPTIPGARLVVIDLVTGALDTVSSELAVLFQWNRRGDALLYATVGDEPFSLVWNVWSDGQSAEIVSFTLQPPWLSNLVPFFDQYAQSVQFWSSSGEYISYPAVVDANPVVVIQPIDGTESVMIPAATWVAWAPSG